MEFINVIFKAIFLGISAQGVPFSVIVFLIYQSIKKSGKVNKVLFLSCFTSFLIISILIILGKSIVIESFIIQFIANILNCVLSLFIAFKISSHIIAKRKVDFKDLYTLNEEDDCSEYQDIYSVSNDYYDDENSSLNFYTFFTGLLLILTDSNWLIWCDISARALLFQAYTNCNIYSLGGFLGIVIFIACFLLSIFLLFFIVYKIISVLKKFMNIFMFNIISITASLFFLTIAIKSIIGAFNLFNLL